ncbi:hypothetical protein ACR79T_12575 [Sphingobacterium spiritivorum]|uniref:hypothetical protein n=1 Tax=Sphingobacterium spiritivorum TaxID=258 RepID=UPI003DA61A89
MRITTNIIMIKNILKVLAPILIVVLIDWMDNFSGYKTFILDIRKDKAIAEIVHNPFYKIKRIPNLDIYENFELFNDSFNESEKKYIIYKYSDKSNNLYLDSINGLDFSDNSFLSYTYSRFAEQLITKPPGYKFDIYYYRDISIPSEVYNENLSYVGKKKIYIQNHFVLLFSLASLISICIGIDLYRRNKN